MELSLFKWNLKLVILVVSVLQIRAQETKGGEYISVNSQSSSQTKGGGGGFSSFRESIESFKRQQQQVAQPISQTNIVKESVSSFSSSAVQRPVTLSQQSIVVEQQEQQQQQENGLAQSEPALYGGVAGTPGVDFPNYINIPNTKFRCDGLPFNPGMYADESTGCQVYHLCYQGRMESFLCGIGTVFNQAIMNCDFWHSVDCSKSSQYYQLNADFGKSVGEPAVLQQPRAQQVSSKTSSSRVESSSFVQLPRAQPPVVTSTSFVQRQSSNKVVQRPALINTIQSSSEFTSSRLSSQPQLLGGKTSIRREEQNFRSSGGLLSPSRQPQRISIDSNSGQFTSESSTQIKVMSSATMENETSNRSSVSVGSSLVVADDGPTARPQQHQHQQPQSVLEKPSYGKTQRKTSSLGLTTSSSNQDDGGWKPYFKSKTNPRPSSPTAQPTPIGTTSTTSTTTPIPQPPAEPATISQPDQEPVFSRQSTTTTTTTESPTPSASIEPDVGPATAATETPSIPSTVTMAGQAEADTPAKSAAPPPTEEPSTEQPAQQTTTTTTPTTTTTTTTTAATPPTTPPTTAPTLQTTSTEAPTTSSSTDSSTGSTEMSSSAAAERGKTTTTKAVDSPSSSVEYAGGGNEANESSEEKMEESKKRAAARKRKAT